MAAWQGSQRLGASAACGALLVIAVACGRGDDKSPARGGQDKAEQQAAQAATSSSTGFATVPGGAAQDQQGQRSSVPQAAGAPPSGQPGQAEGQSTTQQLPSIDRKIIHNVFLDLTVKDVPASFERIQRLAQDNGGFVAESNVRTEGKERRASVTIRVPAARYVDVLAAVRGLATNVEAERGTANDVTEEYTDLRSRLRNLEATEQQLLTYLSQAKNIQETFQVQDRINQVRLEIDRLKGRINLYDRITELATIQVQLRPEAAVAQAAKEPSGARAALTRGWDASTEMLGGLAMATLMVLAFSWWLLPVVALAIWLARRGLRRRGTGLLPATANAGNPDVT
jgi:hypothetical protein